MKAEASIGEQQRLPLFWDLLDDLQTAAVAEHNLPNLL